MKNKYGVEIVYHDGIPIPEICTQCKNLEWEWDVTLRYVYCIHNIWLPKRKGTCKKYSSVKDEDNEEAV
jgi:hypothetical protein